MTSRTAVEGVLARVRPFLVADGGDIQLVAVDGDEVRVRLLGACADCPTSHMTLHVGLEAALRRLSPALRIIQVA
ncbi:NifU family protein [Luteitalea sp.]|jgi:Fe-S cluster biogenesis protein NfuA|uniref:NifU family protein n=1 Tax=Luteitalea sp. TaxID=2004800 RepID=UPI0025BD8532|nr:NifU family protein [Luteitalea sp.]